MHGIARQLLSLLKPINGTQAVFFELPSSCWTSASCSPPEEKSLLSSSPAHFPSQAIF